MKTNLKRPARPSRQKEMIVKDTQFTAVEAAVLTRSAGPKKPVRRPNRPGTRPR